MASIGDKVEERGPRFHRCASVEGVAFRRSPGGDLVEGKVGLGEAVAGECVDGWLRCGDLFLPTELDGTNLFTPMVRSSVPPYNQNTNDE